MKRGVDDMLAHLKILDFSMLLPGPYTTMLLADLGAEVLRVESPTRKDLIRTLPPLIDDDSAVHKQLNRSKKSIALDLKQPEAISIVKQLIGEYDVLVEQFRPGVMERLGLGYEELRKVNPRIIYCSITGYGQTGPYRDRPGHDINYLALAGILGYSGRKAEGPSPLGIQLADLAGGSFQAAIGILAAVLHREQAGVGQHIDVSMTDGAFALNVMHGTAYLASGINPGREKLLLNGGTFYDVYKTKDDRYFSVGSIEPQFRLLLCKAIGREDLGDISLSDDPQHIQHFKEAVKNAFIEKDFSEWQEIFHNMNACVEPVLSFAEACEHPQTIARGLIVEVPTHNATTLKQIAQPIRFSEYKSTYSHVGGSAGEHTREVLTQLGYSAQELESLQEKGAIKCTKPR